MLTFKSVQGRGAVVFSAVVFSTMNILFFQNCTKGFQVLSKDDSAQFASSLPFVDGPGAAPIRRLSNTEYKNSLTDALSSQFAKQNSVGLAQTIMNSDTMISNLSMLPADISTKRLGADQLAAFISPTRFSTYTEIASAVAGLLTGDLATLKAFVGACAISNSNMSNTGCVDAFINSFGLQVFRTPVKAAELTELKVGVLTWKNLIGRMLAHPRFFNHIEREGTLIGSNGIYKLSSYEIEARLCAVFWKSIPDSQGLAVAASDALRTTTGLRAEVKRILSSPKAQETLWNFYQQWLAASRIPDRYDVGAVGFAAFAAGVNLNNFKANIYQDGKDFLNYVTWTSKGKLEDIFRSPLILTTDPGIASIYGVTARADSGQPPSTDTSGHYKGILTRLLVTTQKPSVEGDTNHILRGVFLATNLLGIELGSPANFGDQNAAANQVPKGASTRDEVAIKTSANTCKGCHSIINPSGFALGHYDTLGRYQTVERRWRSIDFGDGKGYVANVIATNNIDSTTTLVINGLAYNITDVPSLVDSLFTSGAIYDAFAKYYFRFAFGRIEDPINDLPLLTNFKTNLKIQSLTDALESLAMHPDFSRVKASN